MSSAEFLSLTCQRHVSVVFVIEFLKMNSLFVFPTTTWLLFILLSIEFDSAIAFIIKSVCRERRSEEEYTSKTFTWHITLTFESN